MRKSFFAVGLMLAALALTNCQRELIEDIAPASEPNFELFAQPVSTKTVNDGLKTKWAAEDAINVFHAEAGSTTYVSDGKFTIKDADAGNFSGIVQSLTGDGHDWYAFYPYTEGMTGSLNDGWILVGGDAANPQVQNGNGSTAHLSGKACPLCGAAKGVASGTVPSIEMNHLTSVVKVTVTNNSGEEQTIKSVSFTGTEEIAGWFKADLTKSPAGYANGDNVSRTASLSVNDGNIAAGASADFYIVIKPFTAPAQKELKIAVNGYEKIKTFDSDVTFAAGHIKRLNFDLDKKVTYPDQLFAWYYQNDPFQKLEKATVLNAVADKVGQYQGFLYTGDEGAQKNFLFRDSESDDETKFWSGNEGNPKTLTNGTGWCLYTAESGLHYIKVDLTSLTWEETQVSGIEVAGDFNGWSLDANPMAYNAETRRWEAKNVVVGESTAAEPRIQFVLGDWKWKYGDWDGTGSGDLKLDDSGFKLELGTYDFALDLRSFDAPRYSVTKSDAVYPAALYAYYLNADGQKGDKAADLKVVEGKSGQYEGFLYTESNAVNFLFYGSEADDATVYWGDNSQYNLTASSSWKLWSGHPGLNYVTVDLKMMEWKEVLATPHVCGDFNQWKVTDENKMNYVGNNQWEATIEVGNATREDGEATRIQFWLGNHDIRVYGDWGGTGTLKKDDPGFKFSDVGTYKFVLDLTNLDSPAYSVTKVE